jgi:hypothetical protein
MYIHLGMSGGQDNLWATRWYGTKSLTLSYSTFMFSKGLGLCRSVCTCMQLIRSLVALARIVLVLVTWVGLSTKLVTRF